MPTRLIRDGILDSDRVNSLSEREELFYRKLHSVADDYGLFDARAPILKSKMYALRPSVRETDMTHLLAACEKAGLIAQYSDNGKPYGVILDFGQQRKTKKPKYPMPNLKSLGLIDAGEGVYKSYTKNPSPSVAIGDGIPPTVTDSHHPSLNADAKCGCEMRNADAKVATSKPDALTTSQKLSWSAQEGWQGLTDDLRAKWGMAYPACDIDANLARMDVWLRANPRRAVKSNWAAFAASWLTKEQNSGGELRYKNQGQGNGAYRNRTQQGRTVGTLNEGADFSRGVKTTADILAEDDNMDDVPQ